MRTSSVKAPQMPTRLTTRPRGPEKGTDPPSRKPRANERARIRLTAIEVLQGQPEGLTNTELTQAILRIHPARNVKSLANDLANLDRHLPALIYKPVKGIYRHTKFIEGGDSQPAEAKAKAATATQRVPEEKFYGPFAAWLKNDLEEVTLAIPLGGNLFRDQWGTPDVIGKYESRPSDVIKGPTGIVAAEIKVDTASLLIGFGQACAYLLFCHKSYLVVPDQTPAEELDRLIALCQLVGIGLVIFDASSLAKPDFRLMVRPVKHEPDLFYTNRYIKRVESKLFS